VTRCAVVGAGAWGTALADLLVRNGHDVKLWAFEPDVVDSINERHENARFLAGHRLASGIEALNDVEETVDDAELVTFATPSAEERSARMKSAFPFAARIAATTSSPRRGSLPVTRT